MKKEINSKSRRKWIRGGLAAFASVALLTTGFAVWVVGSNKTSDKGDVDITVDTAENNSIIFTFNLGDDKSIKLKEGKATTDGHIINTKAGDVATDPLKITYKQSTVKYGKSYPFAFKSIQFSILEPAEEEKAEFASVKVTDSELTGAGKRTENEFTYIEAPKAIDISGIQATGDGNTKIISIPAGELEFSWGSFFEHDSPVTFYNKKYKDVTDDEALTTAADEITTELDNMRKNFLKSDNKAFKKIKLQATLSENSVTPATTK